jgi:hypothetical protein
MLRTGDSNVLIKTADDQSAFLKELELRASGVGSAAKQAADQLRIRKAGLKGESESAYLIDFDFAGSANWAVVHDLRLEHRGRTAQIDHLLINRWLDIYVLESKHFHAGLRITETGEFLRWDNYRKNFSGMASPLEQNDRHIAVLRDVVESIEWPQRFGLRIAPSFQSLVLVAPNARIDRSKRFDSSRVIKADQLKKQIWKDIDGENPILGLLKTAAKIVSSDTVEFVARQLAAGHRPLARGQKSEAAVAAPTRTAGKERIEPTIGLSPLPAGNTNTRALACKSCGKQDGQILYGKFGYYFKCDACDGNTNIRFACQPGHNPRLRKDGLKFYRECAECGSSTLFHRNRS